jgi:2-keto-4-pentenoate hydratase/2-oxohepta-3-ene-1,7-dioic acid hydratase in catechol pathway
MKIVTFGPKKRVGLLCDNRVMDINIAVRTYLTKRLGVERAAREADSAAPADLCGFIEAGPEALDLAEASFAQLEQSADTAIFVPLASAAVAAPWPGRRIACAGANYAEHIQKLMANMGQPTTREEVERDWRASGLQGFWKMPHEVMGDGEQITYPSRSTRLDYEAEVAIVIGKRGKDIPVEEAPAYIWGVTLFNDWTDRDAVRPLKLPLSFNLGKNFDCSTSLGPCICVRGGVTPQDTAVALTVNGEVRQSFRTSDMMFSFAEFIAGLSRDFTLLPGDIIAGGTGVGTAMDSSKYDSNRRSLPDLFLQVGDEVEGSSPLIGVLRNRIVSKS